MYIDTEMVSSIFDTVLVYRQNMEDDDKYVRITFRMPKELHARLGAEAERTSKSMNAEIVARLQASFDDSGAELARLIEEELASAAHKGETTTLKMELVKARLENLNIQLRMKGMESESLAAAAKTDADFAALRVKIDGDFDQLIADGESLKAEQDALVKQRDMIVANLSGIRKALAEKRAGLEQAIAKRPPKT